MKKVLILVVLLIIFLVGCGTGGTGDGGGEPVINYANVTEVVDSIDLIYMDLESLKFGKEEVQTESFTDVFEDMNEVLANEVVEEPEIVAIEYKKEEEEIVTPYMEEEI